MSFSFLKEKKLNTEVFFVYATYSIWTNQTNMARERQHTATRVIVDIKTTRTAHASMETVHMDPTQCIFVPPN